MGNKKQEDRAYKDWLKSFNALMDRISGEPSENRRHKIPVEYIKALADRIHQTQPTIEILENTLVGFYTTFYPRIYARRIADAAYFKNKREQRLKNDWNNMRTVIDDIVNENKKDNQKKK